MRTRIITSIVLLFVLGPAVLYGGWVFNILMVLVALIGSMELIHMAKISRRIIPSFVTYLGVFSIVYFDFITNFIPEYLMSGSLTILTILFLLICTVVIKGYDFTKAGISALTIFYLGFGGYAAVTIRSADLYLFLFILAVIVSTDIGAYFIGSKIGKRKLAPTISPNKTLEGSIGGMVMALIIAAVYLRFADFTYTYSYGTMLIIAVVLSGTGQFGDLIESAFKRHFGVKDSGHIIPGHGGILDRFDSVLFTLMMALVLGIL